MLMRKTWQMGAFPVTVISLDCNEQWIQCINLPGTWKAACRSGEMFWGIYEIPSTGCTS